MSAPGGAIFPGNGEFDRVFQKSFLSLSRREVLENTINPPPATTDPWAPPFPQPPGRAVAVAAADARAAGVHRRRS